MECIKNREARISIDLVKDEVRTNLSFSLSVYNVCLISNIKERQHTISFKLVIWGRYGLACFTISVETDCKAYAD